MAFTDVVLTIGKFEITKVLITSLSPIHKKYIHNAVAHVTCKQTFEYLAENKLCNEKKILLSSDKNTLRRNVFHRFAELN